MGRNMPAVVKGHWHPTTREHSAGRSGHERLDMVGVSQRWGRHQPTAGAMSLIVPAMNHDRVNLGNTLASDTLSLLDRERMIGWLELDKRPDTVIS